jgi:hypothetical protein
MVTVIIAFLLLAIAGVGKAVMDKVSFHYYDSIFVDLDSSFWDPFYSHLNKYKGGDPSLGSRFFGSTTFLVWTTDAWHLFQAIYGIATAIGIFLLGAYSSWYMAIIGYSLSRVMFQIFFKRVFTKSR